MSCPLRISAAAAGAGASARIRAMRATRRRSRSIGGDTRCDRQISQASYRSSSTKGQREDANDHRCRADTPTHNVALREHARAEHRADEDADLARRRDIGDRAHDERGEHKDVRESAEDADPDDVPSVAQPRRTNRVAMPERDGRDHDRLTYDGRPVIEERRDQDDRDGRLIPERVEGDDRAGRERKADRPARSITAKRARIAGQDQGARDYRKSAGHCDRGRSLAEDRDRADRREERTARTRDGVHEREVSGAIPGRQRREVERLQTNRDRDEDESGPPELRTRDDEDRDRERRKRDRAHDVREPQKWRVGSRAFGKQVPRRVKDSGYQDKTQSKETH